MTHSFIKRDQHCTYDKWDLVRINFGRTHCARSEDMTCLRYGRGEGFCYEGEYRGSPSLMFLTRISFLAFQLLEFSSRHLQLLVMNNEQLEPHGTKILLYRKGSRQVREEVTYRVGERISWLFICQRDNNSDR